MRVLSDRGGQLITILTRHVHVCHNQIGLELLGLGQSRITIVSDGQIIILMCKGDLDDLLNRYTVVSQQQFLAHANLLIPSARIA